MDLAPAIRKITQVISQESAHNLHATLCLPSEICLDLVFSNATLLYVLEVLFGTRHLGPFFYKAIHLK